jgi:hypothetical protein
LNIQQHFNFLYSLMFIKQEIIKCIYYLLALLWSCFPALKSNPLYDLVLLQQ